MGTRPVDVVGSARPTRGQGGKLGLRALAKVRDCVTIKWGPMSQHTIMTINAGNMNNMFTGGVLKDTQSVRDKATALAAVIARHNPDLIAICEGANEQTEHDVFIASHLPGSGYAAHVPTPSRGGQQLVFYHRPPFALVTSDDSIGFYEPWNTDVDADGVTERLSWERKPLEAVFAVGAGGDLVRFILVHAKSKLVSKVADLYHFQKLAAAARKKLCGQALKLRERLDQLATAGERVIVLGDMNDGPGLDAFEQALGKSFVETVMGSVFHPSGIFHNTLGWQRTAPTAAVRNSLFTVEFDDPIVEAFRGEKHKVWLDHILASPNVLDTSAPLHVVPDSGRIDTQDATARTASDHFSVLATLEVP